MPPLGDLLSAVQPPLVLVANPDPKKHELCIAYIDDITFVVWAKSFGETHAMLTDMMTRREGALAWSSSHNSTFELVKTACIDFSMSKSTPRPTLTIDSQDIIPVFSHTLLGVVIDQELRWKDQCNKALTRGMQWVTQLGRLGRMSYRALASVLHHLYPSIAVPCFTYTADIWFSPITIRTALGHRNTGSLGFARRLARIQSTAARAILRAMRSTPVHSLDAHTSLLQMHLLLNEACQRVALCLASTPSGHPLFKAVVRCTKGRKSHVTSLQRILQFAGCKPGGFEKWSLARKSRSGPSPVTFPKHPAALMEVFTDHTHIQVYAEGARSPEGVGAAAVSFMYGEVQKTMGFKLGAQNSFSVLDVELTAIILAAHLILKTPVVDNAVIFSDSQTAIRAMKGGITEATQSVLRAAKHILNRARQKAGGTEVCIQWCPGHAGVWRNKLSDREAKKAAKGKSYPQELVPATLAKYCPGENGTTKKRAMKEANQVMAVEYWNNTAAGVKFLERYHRLSPFNFLAHSRALPRSRATLLFRLITGHVVMTQ